MTKRMQIIILALATAGCRRGAEPAPAAPDCAAAVGAVIDHLTSLEIQELESMPAEDPLLKESLRRGITLEDLRRQHRADAECAKRAITKSCIDDAWSASARSCMLHADDLPDCADSLTALQKTNTERVAAPCETTGK